MTAVSITIRHVAAADRDISKEVGAHSVGQKTVGTHNAAGAWNAPRGDGRCAIRLSAPVAFSLAVTNLNPARP